MNQIEATGSTEILENLQLKNAGLRLKLTTEKKKVEEIKQLKVDFQQKSKQLIEDESEKVQSKMLQMRVKRLRAIILERSLRGSFY